MKKQTKLQKLLDAEFRCAARIAHHSGFFPLPWWKHLWIHIRLWWRGI